MQPTLLQIRCCCPSRVATVLGRFVRRRNQHCRPSAAAAHRVLQRSLAGSCKDATETVAHPLQQRIGCCNSAQCDNAGLLHESAVCCNGAPHVETTDDSVAEQVDAQLVAARCNGAACCNACCSEVQPAVAQPNLLRKAHDNVMHTSAICCSRVATDHSPLQQTTAPVQPAAVSSTQGRRHAHSTGRACRTTAARLVAAHDDLLQRCNPLQQTTLRCNLLQRVRRSADTHDPIEAGATAPQHGRSTAIRGDRGVSIASPTRGTRSSMYVRALRLID
jgi:hypothetical protein